MAEEQECSLIIFQNTRTDYPSIAELEASIKDNDPKKKQWALKQAIVGVSNGEDYDRILMVVISYCAHCPDHMVQKLVCLFFEVINKYKPDGSLKEEMILVCNALQNDLNHPNEYIRGATLRFLCRIREVEIMRALIVPIKDNLTHRHSYVRKNAVMTVYYIYKNFGDNVMPDAPDLIQDVIVNETDISARRNAFLMLFNTNQQMAIQFMLENLDKITTYGDGFQILALELIRRACKDDPSYSPRFVKILLYLLNNMSNTVAFEAASTLIMLSSGTSNVQSAVETMIQIMISETDNNVKLIVLNRIDVLKNHYQRTLQSLALEILRGLNAPNEDVRKKILDIVVDLTCSKNIDQVVDVLKKQMMSALDDQNDENSGNFRQLIVDAIHKCAFKFPHVAKTIVLILMNFLPDKGAINVMNFVKEILYQYPESRSEIIKKLLEMFPVIVDQEVYHIALYSLGYYCNKESEIVDALYNILHSCETPEPIITETRSDDNPDEVTQIRTEQPSPPLRSLLDKGDIYLGSSVIVALTKLLIKYYKIVGDSDAKSKDITVQVLLLACNILQTKDADITTERERVSLCINLLLKPDLRKSVSDDFLKSTDILPEKVNNNKEGEEGNNKQKVDKKKEKPKEDYDTLINFRQLRGRRLLGLIDLDLDDENVIQKVTQLQKLHKSKDNNNNNNQGGSIDTGGIYQLTGFSDPIYVEAHLKIHGFDTILDFFVTNRTEDTLTDVTIELAAKGDMKIVERPPSFTLPPKALYKTRASMKVSSTETSHIFGNMVFTPSSRAMNIYLNLSDIKIDVMEYIYASECSDADFRKMWAAFEWENKVCVVTHINNIYDYLNHIVDITNTKCLTPLTKINGPTQFLAANLYAKTIFGEDALINLSIAQTENKVITGNIRIRSKTQGIALSLGDRITSKQGKMEDI